MSGNPEKIKIETKETGNKEIGEETPKMEIAEEETISKKDIAKQEAEIKAQDKEELAKQREKIKEAPGREEEGKGMTEEERIKILSEKWPGASEAQLKSYVEALAKLVDMNIIGKGRGGESLSLKEQLALQDWKNQKAALDFLSKSEKTIETMEGVKKILKEAVERKEE